MKITRAVNTVAEITNVKIKGEKDMKENYTVCNCMQVKYNDIATALEGHNKFEDVLKLFDAVQAVTHCSTGCGGCHDKVLEVISEIMMA